MTRAYVSGAVAAAACALLVSGPTACAPAGDGPGDETVQLDDDDVGGVVTGDQGPEAGVWVIAETRDLPTKYIKTVVTDDHGRYLLPDLPDAGYDIWVRGYGLVDSPKVRARPGQYLDLTAVVAPDPAAAAEYYPANYWYALLEPPPKSDFPGTGPNGNGIPEALLTQGAWLGNIKMTNACTQCHQMGTKATREIPPAIDREFDDSYDAWEYRTKVGASGPYMASRLAPLGRRRALEVFADWSERIAAGELPPDMPPRPHGVERNLVVTQWEFGTDRTFVHDVVSTNRQDPTINTYGPIVGVAELSGNFIELLDPVDHVDRRIEIPPHDPSLPAIWGQNILEPSPYWGEEKIWAPTLAPHNPMFDSAGRVWITARGGCRVFDPRTDEVTHVPGCQAGHHLQIDDNDVLWADSGGGTTYFDIPQWDETGDDEASGGLISFVLDTNGNGDRDEPPVAWGEPPDPARDTALQPGGYDVIPNPVDGSVWISRHTIPGQLVRVDPETRLSEVYEPPYMNEHSPVDAYLPHGIDVDRQTGVIWTGLNSGHFAEFDRAKCTAPLNGPEATGQHCPEGWTLHEVPGPQFKGVTDSGGADSHYLNWVDWHNTSGLGDNTPILTGTGSDSLVALDDGEWVTMRVPYPMGFNPRGLDGRIDDPDAGWKGRGLWSTHAEQSTWHQEGGKGERPKIVQFQIRPDPLAK